MVPYKRKSIWSLLLSLVLCDSEFELKNERDREFELKIVLERKHERELERENELTLKWFQCETL